MATRGLRPVPPTTNAPQPAAGTPSPQSADGPPTADGTRAAPATDGAQTVTRPQSPQVIAARDGDHNGSDGRYRRLPTGAHGLGREEVARDQRERLQSAMVELIAERGYQAVRILDLTKLAH